MLPGHECCYWPWKVRHDQVADTDQIIANARADMEAEIVRSMEDPTMYEYDILTDGKAVKVGKDTVVPGVGKVVADVVVAGIIGAWRKGTKKPKLVSMGKIG